MKTVFLMLTVAGILMTATLRVISQNLYAATAQDDLYRINLADCSQTYICHLAGNYADIAFEGGELYATHINASVPFYPRLCRIDTLTGGQTFLGGVEDEEVFNGLVGDGYGHLYAGSSGGDIFRYDIQTGVYTKLGMIGYSCMGDLAFKNGFLYMLSRTNDDPAVILIRMTLDPFTDTIVGSMPFGDIASAFGLVTVPQSGTNLMYASVVDYDLHENSLYRIDETDASFTKVCNDVIGGMEDYIYGLTYLQRGDEGIPGDDRIDGLSVFPNPAATFLTVSMDVCVPKNCTLTLTTSCGIKVLEENLVTPTEHTLDVSALPEGIYLLSLTMQQKRWTQKVLIRR